MFKMSIIQDRNIEAMHVYRNFQEITSRENGLESLFRQFISSLTM